MSVSATIVDVQRFCLHDGPGIRTVVFFKGCSMRCSWCQNPESQQFEPEMAFYADRCIDCRKCAAPCAYEAIVYQPGRRLDASKCNACGACAQVCPTAALRRVGAEYTSEALLAACLRDREFAVASGGGVTLSGGEPVLQTRFLQEFLPRLKADGTHVLLETAGNYPFELLEPLLGELDHVYFDWKVAGTDALIEHTGRRGDHILSNLAELSERRVPLEVRMVLVEGVNTTGSAIASTCESLSSVGVRQVELLRYNFLWEAKLPRLNPVREPFGARGDADALRVIEMFEEHGVRARAPWFRPVPDERAVA